jgi:hypothetical protein
MADALARIDDDTETPQRQATLSPMWQVPLDQGWQVIMLEPRSCEPRPVNWQSYYNHMSTNADVRNWSDALPEFDNFNAAIVTGRLSGLVVLALANAGAVHDAAKRGLPERTIAARGPAGELHLYFARPAQGASNEGEAILWEGATLIGEGGFVPSPGSVIAMPNGRDGRWQWEEGCSPEETTLANLPDQ